MENQASGTRHHRHIGRWLPSLASLWVLPLALAACSSESEVLPVPDLVEPKMTATDEVVAGEPELQREPQSPPIPPPPPAPNFFDNVRSRVEHSARGDSKAVSDAQGPREAVFLTVIDRFQAKPTYAPRALCLRNSDSELVALIASKRRNIFPEEACRWDEGGVVADETGEPAMFLHARIECANRDCAAEGGATYGNLGAEGFGFRLTLREEGWAIEELGISWIS